MQIVPFLTHYQLVYANFDFSSFSLISYNATVALLQARLGPFSPVFGLQYVSVKFKRLIISVLEKPLKSRICTRAGCRLQISQAQRPKTKKWFNKIFCPNISPQYIDRAGKAEPGKPLFSSPAV